MIKGFDGLTGFPVEPAGGVIIQIMAEICRHDDQRFRATPEPFNHFGHVSWFGVTHGERDQLKRSENFLEKRQVHFETVFLSMARIEYANLGHIGDRLRGGFIKRDGAERRFKGIGA